jgi:glycosyltransferase involved in cell wall biosynthesis
MRVLIVSNLYPPKVLGGYEILCAQVVASLARRGASMMVLTTPASGEGGVSEETGPAGEKILRSLGLYLPFGAAPRLARRERQSVESSNRRAAARAIDLFKPDAVFVWSQLRLGLAAAREAESRGLPVAYTMNDDHILGFKPGSDEGLKGRVRSILEKYVFPASTYAKLRLDPVVVISDTVRKRLAGVDSRFARSIVAFQGVPLESYPPKAQPGSAQDPFRVLYAGQLHEYKGVHTLVEAMGILKNSGRYVLTVAGAGDPSYEAKLRERVAELGLDARFLGRVPASLMGSLYRESDLLAFTSVWDEPFGLTHLEAMASGTPVVSVGHGGPGEFLKDGENALIFGKENPEALSLAISRMATDADLRTRLALAGRRTVEEKFSLERYVDRLEAILEGAIAGKLSETGGMP